MSTPVKPPGGPSSPSAPDPSESSGSAGIEGRPGELRELVDQAAQTQNARPNTAAVGGHALDAIKADLAAGRVDVDQAIDRLVQRAMASANGLPASHRATLEARLREALEDDPTLIALRKDLERGSNA